MDNLSYIVLLVFVSLLFFGVILYNALVALRNQVDESFSDIGVQQKRRYDLIPNLVETVKGYAGHEKKLFENVTEARSNAISAQQGGNIQDMQQKENMLSQTLKSLFAVSENYPDLKANQNFLHLQEELTDAEDKIQAARRYYNQSVRDFNVKIEQVPSNIIASLFSFKQREFFAIEEQETSVPKVSF
jgi:LemA protein